MASPLVGGGSGGDAGMVPCCLRAVLSVLGGGAVGPADPLLTYLQMQLRGRPPAGVCWSCGDALQSADFPLAWARLRPAAVPALLAVGRGGKAVN